MACSRDWVGTACFRKRAFKIAQCVSIGLRSGEYVGRYLSVQSLLAMSCCVCEDLWNEALSMMTVWPGLSDGSRACATQALNTSVSQ